MQVKVGKPEVKGFASEAPGLIVVRAPLEPKPNEYWRQLFERDPYFTGWPMSLAKPRISSAEAEIRVPDGSIEQGVTSLRERVEAINREYAERVAPELERQRQAQEKEKADREARLADAQRQIDELGDD